MKQTGALAIIGQVLSQFGDDDGWAMSSHVALSVLVALFPFLIFVTALAGFFGTKELSGEVARLIFEIWPDSIAQPIARQIDIVLTVPRGDLLTLGAAAALFFASNGVEAMRVALNRAYQKTSARAAWKLRLQSLALIVAGAVLLLAVAFLLVILPLALAILATHLPWLQPLTVAADPWRLAIALTVLVLGLIGAHLWLPEGRRGWREVWPGVLLTLVLWLAGAALFSIYLDRFGTYATTYAGLAGVMAALAFLYFVAAAFILGGELNAVLARARDRSGAAR